MATRTDQNTFDLQYFNKLFPIAYPSAPKVVVDWMRKNLIKNGDLAIESLLETAIAKSNKIKKVSSEGYDFLNPDGTPGGDAKKCTAHKGRNRPRLEATVSNFQAKIGDLYVCIYEPISDKFHYFRVPHKIYSNRKTLTWYFELDGTPRECNMRSDSPPHLWKYKVTGIKNLLKKGKSK